MASIFNVDENGNIGYEPVTETENVSAPGASVSEADGLETDSAVETTDTEIIEGEVKTNGDNVDTLFDSGVAQPDTLEDEEILLPSQETLVVNDSDNAVPVALSDELTTALIDAVSPAGGALSASTLDYFDRLCGSFPSDYVYIAYRIDTNNSSDGVIIFGDDFDYDGTTLIFGKDARQVRVQRVSSSYNSYTEYREYGAEGVSVSLSKSGTVVYYSNVGVGYPLLGGYEKPFDISPFIVVGLLSAMTVAILTKLFNRK